MNDQITPAPNAAPPPANQIGSLWGGFWLAWGALIGGYMVVVGILATFASAFRGGGVPDEIWMFLAACPWLLVVGLIIGFSSKGKTRTAKGIVLGLASIAALFVLLAAACFTLLSNMSFR